MRLHRGAVLLGIALVALAGECGDQTTTVYDSGAVQGTVAAEADPLPDVTVSYTAQEVGGTWTTSGSVVTDHNGAYEITFEEIFNPLDVDVSIPADPTPETHFHENEKTVTVGEGETRTADFDGTYVRTASITGTVVAGSEGLEGITVTLAGPNSAQTTTDADGRYAFPDLRAGTYTVTISGYPQDVTFASSEHDVTVDVGENATQDFAGTRPEPSVIITDWTDENGDPVALSGVAGDLGIVYEIDSGGHTIGECAIVVETPDQVYYRFFADNCAEGTNHATLHTDWFDIPDQGWSDPDGYLWDWSVDQAGRIPNGTHEIFVEVTDDADESWESDAATVTLDNPNKARVGFASLPVEVTSGAEYYGGEDVAMRVQPFIYDGSTVGRVDIQVSPGTQTPSGSGTLVLDQTTDDAAPFIFTVPLADNADGIEDAAGDGPDGPGGAGTDICPLAILDDQGTDITDTFDGQCRTDVFFDFDPPDQAGGVTIEGSYPWPFFYMTGDADLEWYAFTLPGVSDDGVGGTYDEASGLFQIDLYDGGEPPTLLVADVTGTGDLPENPPGGVEMHPTCVRLEDALGNEVPEGEITLTPGDDFGVDLTPPTFLIVDLDGRGDPPVYDDTDYEIRLEISDPDLGAELEPAAPGCGVDDEDCASQCKDIDATVLDGPDGAPATLDVRQSPDVLNGDYSGWIGLYNNGDPGNHDPDIFNTTGTYPPTVTLDVTVSITGDGTITITGAPPFVDVTGTFTDGDYFSASGTGTVAGVDNVEVTFDGGITSGFGLFGDVEFGVNGELSDGESVRYYFEASRISGPDAGPEDFIVVLPSGMPNGTYVIRIDAADQAYYEPNVGSTEFTFILNRGG